MKYKQFTLIPVLLFLLLFVLFTPDLRSEERVLSFDVTAAIQEDASMLVTERIRVNIEQKRIRQGITHALPIRERYENTKLRHYGFELISVTLDGKPVNYYKNEAGYYTGLAIGTKNVGAPLGEHTYEIVYKTTGHVRFLSDKDEIYYNVMGNNWEFPVDRLSFTLQLPNNNTDAVIDALAYTGARGASGSDYHIENKHIVTTTRTLNPGEGLTVAIGWKKGLITPPKETFANMMGANRTQVLVGILGIVLLYFLITSMIFKARVKGPVVPLFSAPQGMTPGYAAALQERGYPGRMFHSDIIWTAINGFLQLNAQSKKEVWLEKNAVVTESKWMQTKGEWARPLCERLTHILFPQKEDARLNLLSADGRQTAQGAFEDLRFNYSLQLQGFWKYTYIHLILGALLTIGLFCFVLKYIYTPAMHLGETYDGALLYLLIYGTCVLLLWACVLGIYRAIYFFEGTRRLVLLCLMPVLGAALIFVLWLFTEEDYLFLALFSVTFLIAVWFCARIPRCVTAKGMEAYRQVVGLEMYIRTAEKNRLAQINAPEDTVEKFEELLPYAIALNCADVWQKRFDKLLLDIDYHPGWLPNTTGQDSYRRRVRMIAGASGIAAAAGLCARASREAARARMFDSSSESTSTSRSSSRSGSVGGGTGGSNVGGW